MAMASVIEAVKSNKDGKQQVSTFGYYNPPPFNNDDIFTTITPFTSPEENYYHLIFPIERLQKLANENYDKLSKMCVNNTMKAVIHDSQNSSFSHSFAFDA
jgi:hypothetical protein